eukprot:1267018-Rhodomonas_salina.1
MLALHNQDRPGQEQVPPHSRRNLPHCTSNRPSVTVAAARQRSSRVEGRGGIRVTSRVCRERLAQAIRGSCFRADERRGSMGRLTHSQSVQGSVELQSLVQTGARLPSLTNGLSRPCAMHSATLQRPSPSVSDFVIQLSKLALDDSSTMLSDSDLNWVT